MITSVFSLKLCKKKGNYIIINPDNYKEINSHSLSEVYTTKISQSLFLKSI